MFFLLRLWGAVSGNFLFGRAFCTRFAVLSAEAPCEWAQRAVTLKKRIMKEKENEKKGCGCGCDFKKEVEEMVNEAKKPSFEERLEKKREMEAAFGKDEERR
jgi:hypothetical protein